MSYFQYNDDFSDDDELLKRLIEIENSKYGDSNHQNEILDKILDLIFGEFDDAKQYILEQSKKYNRGIFRVIRLSISELLMTAKDRKRFYEDPENLKQLDELLNFNFDLDSCYYNDDPRIIRILDAIFSFFKDDEEIDFDETMSPKDMRESIIQYAKDKDMGLLSSIYEHLVYAFKIKEERDNKDEFNRVISIPGKVASVVGKKTKSLEIKKSKPIILVDENIINNIYNHRKVDDTSNQSRAFGLIEKELYSKDNIASFYVTETGLRHVFITYKTLNDTAPSLEVQNFYGILRLFQLIPFTKRIIEATEQYKDLDFDTALMIESAKFIEADYILSDNKARFITPHWDANKVWNTSEFLGFISRETIPSLNLSAEAKLVNNLSLEKSILSLQDIDRIFFPDMHPEARTSPISDAAMIEIGWGILLQRGLEEIEARSNKRCLNLAKIKEIALYIEETIELINQSSGLQVIYFCRNLEKQEDKNQVYNRLNAQKQINIFQQGLQKSLDTFFENNQPEEKVIYYLYEYCQQSLQKDNISSDNLVYKMITKKSWDYLPEAEIFSLVQQEELSEEEVLYLQANISNMYDISIQDPSGYQLFDYVAQNRHFRLAKVIVDRQLSEKKQPEVTSQPEF